MAWQSGYTCIGIQHEDITEDITSVESLFDPKYKGHIGMMGTPRSSVRVGLLAVGVDPADVDAR